MKLRFPIGRNEMDAPAPLPFSGRHDLGWNIDRHRSMRRQRDVALEVACLRGRIELQLDVRLAVEVGRVVQDAAQNKFVTEIGEVRQ